MDLIAYTDTDNDALPDSWEQYMFGSLSETTFSDGDYDWTHNLAQLQGFIYPTPTPWFMQSHDPETDSDGDGIPDVYEGNNRLNPTVNDAHLDKDGDGLTNLQEYELGTRASNPDTDGDGMPDGWEVQYGLLPNSHDANQDKDGDGMSNLYEYQHGLNPSENDAFLDKDGDGMSNLYEYQNGLNASMNDADLDKDGDGLTNLQEYQIGTRANNPDTDGDGFSDYIEVQIGSDPLTNLSHIDSDGDGVPDVWELIMGSMIFIPDSDMDHDNDGFTNLQEYLSSLLGANDTDGDGMPNDWEIKYGLNPFLNDAYEDNDGDGLSNIREYLANTDPNDPDTDNDGISDLIEAQLGLNSGYWDTDKDGLPDDYEVKYGFDPKVWNDKNADTDGDGLTDIQEYYEGTNPRLADTDGDGYSDGAEKTAGTSPLNPNRNPANPGSTNTQYRVSFVAQATGKQVVNNCAVCHNLQVNVGGQIKSGGSTWTLDQEMGERTVTLIDRPTPRPGTSNNPPHNDNAAYTFMPQALPGQTITEIDMGTTVTRNVTRNWMLRMIGASTAGESMKAYLITENDRPPVIVKAPASMVGQNKPWYDSVLSQSASVEPIEVVELSPKVKDENGNDIAGSEKPNIGKPLTPFVEVDPHTNKIAHREIKVKIGDALKDKKVIWTLEPLSGATPATIRGDWDKSPNHKDCFEVSTAYDASGFRRVSQSSGETIVGADGHTAIRVNVPPIGFNQVRVKIQIEGMSTPIDLIDMEVPAVVVIDPGHGGQDSGAVGRTDSTVLEKDLALEYSLRLRQKVIDKFSAEKRGLRLFMTRETTGEFMENSARANLARDKGADVFLSIHFNYTESSTTARGTEYVTRSTGQVNAAEDDQLGVSVQSSTLAAVKANDPEGKHRDPKAGQFAVLSDSNYGNTADYHPIRGIIIEVEFLSHETALESVRLPNPTGTAIKTKFAADVSTDIYNNILNQP